MKKYILITGIIFLFLLFTGIIFKRLHWPGAGVLTTFGIFLFVTVYLPLFLASIVKQMKTDSSGINRLLLIIGFPGIAILTFGILAKIMHWPGASLGLWGGTGLISFALLLFSVVNRKNTGKFSMISVLIVVIILGSFSFNTFRTGNIRTLYDAYPISEAAFAGSSKILWKECENIVKEVVILDTSRFSLEERNALLALHSHVQETDLIIGSIIESIRLQESQYEQIKGPGPTDNEKWNTRNDLLRSENGILALDRKITVYKRLIESMDILSAEEKKELTANLTYPFKFEGSDLLYNYLGVSEVTSSLWLNTMFLWKSKIWETEFSILSGVMQK